jgi:hypothetical protein
LVNYTQIGPNFQSIEKISIDNKSRFVYQDGYDGRLISDWRLNMLGCLVPAWLEERSRTCRGLASAETEAETATQFTIFD